MAKISIIDIENMVTARNSYYDAYNGNEQHEDDKNDECTADCFYCHSNSGISSDSCVYQFFVYACVKYSNCYDASLGSYVNLNFIYDEWKREGFPELECECDVESADEIEDEQQTKGEEE